ncbi:MAG: carbon storage regulator CsrA [Nitrospirae bacterium]|nr:carbon storage regulator CsrA [Candidatus Manganitrophaceae bacterium]
MLVLTRKPGEEIFIGDQIRVVVIEIQGGQVRLGIDAPATIPIYREEVLAKIMLENKKAASANPNQLKDILIKRIPPPEQSRGSKP